MHLAHQRADVHGRPVPTPGGFRCVEHAKRDVVVLLFLISRDCGGILPRKSDTLSVSGLALDLGNRVELEKGTAHPPIRMVDRARPQFGLLFP